MEFKAVSSLPYNYLWLFFALNKALRDSGTSVVFVGEFSSITKKVSIMFLILALIT